MIVPHIRKDERTSRFIVDHEDHDGQRRQPGFKLKRSAAEKLAEITGAEKVAQKCGHTVASLAPKFLANMRANGKAAATIISYQYFLDRDLLPKVGHLDLSEVDLDVVQALRLHLFSTCRVKHASSAYSAFCMLMDDAESWGFIRDHCARNYRRIDRSEEQVRSIILPKTDELGVMFDGPFCAAKVVIGVATLSGLRKGEMRALTPRHIDLDEGYISVQQAVGATDEIRPPKGVAGVRRVPIGDELCELLGMWITRERFSDSEFIFPSKDRSKVSHNSFLPKLVHAYQQSLGLPSRRETHYLGYNLHLLRHTCVALWIEGGADADWVQQKIGHQYLHTTLDVYGGLFDEAHLGSGELAMVA